MNYKRLALLGMLSMILLALTISAAQINSTSYRQTVVVSDGGLTNTSSTNYAQGITLGGILGKINSTSFINMLGFFYTLESEGKAPPIIQLNNDTTFSVTPAAAGTTEVLISFNVTDTDGAGDINATTAVVNLTLGGSGGQYFYNQSWTGSGAEGTCGNHSPSVNVVSINCTVIVPYYINASASWIVNATVEDIDGNLARNDTISFTVNTLSSIELPMPAINFSAVTVGQQNVRAYPHLLINNTGNDDFTLLNITAAPLVGALIPSETIPVGSFGVNVTNSTDNLRINFPSGDQTINIRDPATGGNLTFYHGHTDAYGAIADKGNISLFFWVNIPSSGLSQQLYNSTWNVSVS